MHLPKLTDAQISWLSQQVETYIEEQRQTFGRRAVPLPEENYLWLTREFVQNLFR